MTHHPVLLVIGLMRGTCNYLSITSCGVPLAISSRLIGEALCNATAGRWPASHSGFHLFSRTIMVLWIHIPRKLKRFVGFALATGNALIRTLRGNPVWSRSSINTAQWFNLMCSPLVENTGFPSNCHDIILGVRVADVHIEVMGYRGLDWLRPLNL